MQIRIWSVKGYNGYQLTKKMLENEKWSFDELEKVNPKIKKELEKCLNSGGEVFALTKKKIFKAAYLFKVIEQENEKILVIDKKIILDEVEKCVEEFENDLEVVLGETLIERTDLNKAIWRDNEIEPIKIKIGKHEISASLIWIAVGLMFWILFDSFLWFIVYLCIAFSSGYAVKSNVKISKKKIDAEKTKKKKK